MYVICLYRGISVSEGTTGLENRLEPEYKL